MKNTQSSMTGFFHRLFTAALMLCAFAIHSTAHGETVTFIHTDVLGSPVAATDQAGNVIWREDYNPYGDKRIEDPNSTNHEVWYTGKQYENRTGLSYFGARYYDTTVGRFTGMDPVAFDGANIHTFNRYAYANNNPYKYIDPDGNLPIVVIVPLVAKAIDIGISAYDTYTAYQEGGAKGAVKEAGTSAALSVVPGAKIAKKVVNGAKKVRGVSKGGSAGAMKRLEFQASPKHGTSARNTSKGVASRGPTNGQHALDNSIQVKGTSPRRVGVDKANEEIVVFDQTSDGIFHGHVRSFKDLTSQQQNALRNAGLVDKKGNF